jgi:peptidyl-prolyl cis-trans isomerase A (cyclophilin A)
MVKYRKVINHASILVSLGMTFVLAIGQSGQKEPGMREKARTPAAASAQLPDPARATEQAPDTFRVKFETTKGPVLIEVFREWAPRGADRFYNLVKTGFYDDMAFFRVIDGFMAQFGIPGNPQVAALWKDAVIPDDPVRQSNQRGFLSFATGGPNTRTTQLFINYTDNRRLDSMGFAPFGRVIQGMDAIDILFSDYGEGAPRGRGPSQSLLETRGNDYLRQGFPQLDYIQKATLVEQQRPD